MFRGARKEEAVIEALKKLTEGKRVLILGYGREGKSTWKLLKKTNAFREAAIADKNPQAGEPGVRLITGDGYLEHSRV